MAQYREYLLEFKLAERFSELHTTGLI